jgi:hypothetical protein
MRKLSDRGEQRKEEQRPLYERIAVLEKERASYDKRMRDAEA